MPTLLDRFRRPPETIGHDFTFEDPQVKMKIGEQVSDVSRALRFKDGLRSLGRRWSFRRNFWGAQPAFSGSMLAYEKCRALYRNDDRASNLGSGFCRRIINAVSDFMDLPHSATGDSAVDEFLNKGIHTFWNAEIQQMFRNATRDSKTIVRYRRDSVDDPLVTDEEWSYGYLELYEPEEVEIYYRLGVGRQIEKAYIRHRIEELTTPATDGNTRGNLRLPEARENVLIEEITPETFRFYSETEGRWRDDLESVNDWGFVPLLEAFNEFDSSLDGGQSDFEGPLPFILAFHDVMAQSLQAHKYHSIPKVKFQVADVTQFIANNWPDSFELDELGQPKLDTFSGSVNFKGTEIFFFNSGADEDGSFIEARSVLGDSKTLMEWLLECISIASETPKSILMNQKSTDADEMLVFSKKIDRKRNYFEPFVQMICKMALLVNGFEPVRPDLTWGAVDPQMDVTRAQALQADVMSVETARVSQIISDDTARQHLRRHLPGMKSNQEEKTAAKNNVQIDLVSPNSIAPNSKDKGKNE